jgi:DNA repair protein RecN (Recombination protein N)
MLSLLTVENYGLIRNAELEFASGATIVTGETGSGKTMVLGALAFVLGARAGADVVRPGARAARVTLTFDPDDAMRERLAELGCPLDLGEEASVTREITAQGRSSLRVGGVPVSASVLREATDGLADLVGQHEAQRLLSSRYHTMLVDRAGGAPLAEALEAVRRASERRRAAEEALAAIVADDERARRRRDDAARTVAELEVLAPEAGEYARLHARARVLESGQRVREALALAHEALAGDDRSARTAVGAARTALAGIASLDGAYGALRDRLAAIEDETAEIAIELARALDGLDADPGELDATNERLADYERAMRRHGVEADALAEILAAARAEVEAFDDRDATLARLQGEADAARAELERAAARLTRLRRDAAERLAAAVRRELPALVLPNARFEVTFEPLPEIGPTGAERLEFAFAADGEESAKPLLRCASGGELSRVLLALVVALADRRERTALIFDEIDTGIGGATARAVGERLARLARSGQVVCVTHLAQIAVHAERHYVLEKREGSSGAEIVLHELRDDEERVREIARMLSGESHESALAHARRLLERRYR